MERLTQAEEEVGWGQLKEQIRAWSAQNWPVRGRCNRHNDLFYCSGIESLQ